MSAKAKPKIKNNEPKLADAVALASTTEAVAIASTAEAASPEVGVTLTSVEGTPAVAESPVVDVPTGEAPSRLPLALRARIVTSKAIVSVFASVRAAEAKAVEKARTWITAADAGISKSLLAGEQFLLSRLRVTLE